jgi:penicillin V acylase-like amidase (Ntn superfamily)
LISPFWHLLSPAAGCGVCGGQLSIHESTYGVLSQDPQWQQHSNHNAGYLNKNLKQKEKTQNKQSSDMVRKKQSEKICNNPQQPKKKEPKKQQNIHL